jgi:hypothetical protein
MAFIPPAKLGGILAHFDKFQWFNNQTRPGCWNLGIYYLVIGAWSLVICRLFPLASKRLKGNFVNAEDG